MYSTEATSVLDDESSSVPSTPRRLRHDRKQPTRFTIDHTPSFRRTLSKLSTDNTDDGDRTETDNDEPVTTKKPAKPRAKKNKKAKSPSHKNTGNASGEGREPTNGGRGRLPLGQLDAYNDALGDLDSSST